MRKVFLAGATLAVVYVVVDRAIVLLNEPDDLAVMRNRIIRIAVGVVAAVIGLWQLTACYKIVAPGHVGILAKQSGSDRGVQDFPVQTGRVWYNPINEVVLTYPTYVERAIWTHSRMAFSVMPFATRFASRRLIAPRKSTARNRLS